MDLGCLANLYDRWRDLLPNVHPFYAVKANDDVAILKAMANLGAGFDCASKVNYTTMIMSKHTCIYKFLESL